MFIKLLLNKVVYTLQKYSFLVSWIILGIYLSPYFILGENSYIVIWDVLDYIPMYEIVARGGYLFKDNNFIIPQVMNGLPRVSYPMEFSITLYLLYFFDTFTTLVILKLIIHIGAFLGFRLFAKNHLFRFLEIDGNKHYLLDYSALCFALLPHWILGILSIGGLPILYNSFFNFLFKREKIWDWIVCGSFPFFSSFTFINVFNIMVFGMIFSIHLIRRRLINYKVLAFIGLFSLISILTEYRIFLASFSGFESHRARVSDLPGGNMIYWLSIIFQKITNNISFYLYREMYPSKMFPIIFISGIASLFFSLIYKEVKIFRILSLLFFLTFIFSYAYILQDVWYGVFLKRIPLIGNLFKGFNLRFYVFNPFLWHILFFISIFYISKIEKNNISTFIVVIQITYELLTRVFIYNLPLPKSLKFENYPTYKEYFDEDLFSKIKEYISTNYHLKLHQYRTCALTVNPEGPIFSPAVLIHNGFYTIDGYCVYYPKKYKDIFYQIIKPEIDKNPGFSPLLGNKVYISTNDLNSKGEINSLDINYELLSDLNCKFLFSDRIILNSNNHLVFLKQFRGRYWKIYLYEIK